MNNLALKFPLTEPSGFAELAAGLFWKPEEMVAVIRAYFDESGGHGVGGGLTRLTIGGLIAPADTWKAFEADWNAALVRAGLAEFHGRVVLPETAEQFVEIIGRHIRLGFGFTAVGDVTVEAYETAFVDCLLQVATLSGRAGPISVVFAKHPEFRPGRGRRFWEIVNVDDARLGSVAFADPREMPPLQAADLMARSISNRRVERLREVGCQIFCYENGRLVT